MSRRQSPRCEWNGADQAVERRIFRMRTNFHMTAGLTAMPAKIAGALLLFAAVLGAPQARAQTILAMVNGEPVTAFDVDQRIKLTKVTEHKVLTQKEALEVVINDRVKVKEGKRFTLDLSASDVEDQYIG